MRTAQGVTLLEMLTTISILFIIVTTAIPAFSDFLSRHRATQSVNQLMGIIQFARISAVSRGKTVTLCPSTNGVDCDTNWSGGLLVFEDINSDGKRDMDEPRLRATYLADKSSILSWVSFGSNNHLRFTGQGFTYNQNGSFTLCPASGDVHYAKHVIINRSGRLRLGSDSNNNGVVENSRGIDVNC